jgi:hypothetical protein
MGQRDQFEWLVHESVVMERGMNLVARVLLVSW